MSTVSGLASKADKEKGSKQKYSSLNINSLYKGKSLDNTKTVEPTKHGLQTLGKVGAGRRVPPPANLPSLKSEIIGKNTNVSLVSSSGGQGWAKKDQENTASTQNISNSSTEQNQSSIFSSISETNGLTDSTNSATFVSQTNQSNVNVNNTSQTKPWSNVTNIEESSPKVVNNKLSYFSQEFPSLDGGDSIQSVQKSSSESYGPGPSLRPQTVGNWSKGTSAQNQQQEGNLQQNNGNCVNGLQESSLNQDEIGTRAYNSNTAQNQPRNLSVKPNGYSQSNQHNRQNYQNRYNNQNNGSYNNQYNNYQRQYDNRNRQQNRPREEMPERLKVAILSEKDLQGFDELLDNKKLEDWTKTKNQIDFNAKLNFSEDEDQKSQDDLDDKEELSEKADSSKQNMESNSENKKAENSRYRRDYSNPRPHQSYNSSKSSFSNERGNYQVNLINSNTSSSNVNLSSKTELVNEDSKKLKLKPDVSGLEKAKKRLEEEERKYQLSRQAAQEKLKALEERYKQPDSQNTDQQQTQGINYKSNNRYLEDNINSQNDREDKNKDIRNFSNNRNNDNFNNNNRQFQQSLPPRFKKLQQNLSYNNRFDSNNNSRVNNDQQQKYYKQADRKRNDSQSSGQEMENEGQKRILNRQPSWRNNREPIIKNNKAHVNEKQTNLKENSNKNEDTELISDLPKRVSDLSVESKTSENEFRNVKNDQLIMTDIKNDEANDQNLGLNNISHNELAKTEELVSDKNDVEVNSNLNSATTFVDKKNNLTEIKNLENKIDNSNKKPCDFNTDLNKQKSSVSQDSKNQDNVSKTDLKKDNNRHRNKDNEESNNTRNNQRYDNRYDRNRNDDQNYSRMNQRDYRRQNDKLSKNDTLSVDNRRKKHENYNEDYKNYNQLNRNKFDTKKDYRNDFNKNINIPNNKDISLKSSLNSNKSSNFNDTKSVSLHIRKSNETHDYRNDKDSLNKSSNDKFDNKEISKKMNNRNLKERKVLNESSLDESNSNCFIAKKQYKSNQDSKNSKWVENEEPIDRNKYKEKQLKSNNYEKKNERVQMNQRKASVEDGDRQKSNPDHDNGQHKKKIKDQNEKQKPKMIENLKKPKVNNKNKQITLPPRFFKDSNSNYKDNAYQKDGCLEIKKLDNKILNKRKTNKEDTDLNRSNKNLSLLTKNGLIVSNLKNTDPKNKMNCDTAQNNLNKNILSNSSKSSSFDQQDSGIDLSDQLASNASSQRSSPSSNTGKTSNSLIVSMSCLNNVCKTTSSTNLINSLTSKKSLLRTTNKFVDDLSSSRKVCSVIFENPKNKTDNTVIDKFSNKLEKKITTNESANKNDLELNTALHFAHSEKEKNETESKIDFSFNKSTTNVSKVVGASRNVCEQVSPSTDDLNLKIASVKNVWESMPSMPSVLEINNEELNVEHKYEENKLRSSVRSVDQNVHVLSTINSSNNSNNSSFSFANAIKPISNEELKKTHQQLYQQPHATNQQVHMAQQQSQHQVLISSSPPNLINHINNSNLDNVRRVQNQYQLSNMQRISSPSNLIYNSQSQVGPGGPVPPPTASANVNIYQQFANQMKNMHQGTIMAQFAHVQAAAQQQSHHFATTQHMIQQHQRNHLGQANTMFVPQVPQQLPVQQVPQQVPQPGQVNTADYRLHQQNLAASHLMKQHFVQTPSLHPGTLAGPPVQPTQSVQAPPTAFYQNQNLPAAQKAYYNQQVSVSVPQHALGHHQQQPQPITQQIPQQHVQPQQQQFNYMTSQQFGLINAQNSQLANNQNYRNSKRFI